MKNIMLVIFMACATFFLGGQSVEASAAVNPDGSVAINETNFPEQEFRDRVAETVDKNKDGILSQEEISGETSMFFSYSENNKDLNVTGIEYFVNLKEVSIYRGTGRSSGKIIGTFCKNKNLSEVFICLGYNKYSNKEFSQLLPLNQLKKLEVYDGELSEKALVLATKLETLQFDNSTLKNLDFSKMKNLKSLVFENAGRFLKHIDLSANKKLRLLYIKCQSAKKITLPQNAELRIFTLINEEITSLNLAGCKKLQDLSLYYLPLEELDLSSNRKLESLTIENTPIEKLNLTKNNKLKEVSLHSGLFEVSEPDSVDPNEIPWLEIPSSSISIPWFIKSTYSTKIIFPKKNNITEFTCFTKDKQIDLTRCHKLKKINVSDHSWMKLSKKWFNKNRKKLLIYTAGDEALGLKVKKIKKKYVNVIAQSYLTL